MDTKSQDRPSLVESLRHAVEAGEEAPSEDAIGQRFAQLHLKSLEQNQPERYRTLLTSKRKNEYLNEVGAQASALYWSLMQPAIDRTNRMQSSTEKLGILESARMNAEAEVMRDLVLVPDDETEKAEQQGGYR